MDFEVGYLLALVVIGISFLGFILAMMIDEINKKKGIVTLILSLVLLALGVYFYYVVGQWQKAKGGPSVNQLNYLINVYRPTAPTSMPPIPPGPGD